MSVGICDAAVPNMPQDAFDRVSEQLQATKADAFVALGGGWWNRADVAPPPPETDSLKFL